MALVAGRFAETTSCRWSSWCGARRRAWARLTGQFATLYLNDGRQEMNTCSASRTVVQNWTSFPRLTWQAALSGDFSEKHFYAFFEDLPASRSETDGCGLPVLATWARGMLVRFVPVQRQPRCRTANGASGLLWPRRQPGGAQIALSSTAREQCCDDHALWNLWREGGVWPTLEHIVNMEARLAQLTTLQKLEILSDAAKYDASCASSGTAERNSEIGRAHV